MPNIFHSLIDTDTARRLASEAISVDPGVDEVLLEDALGRVLASDIVSPMNSPPFNRSIKDGYAILSEDLEDASEKSPAVLYVKGRIEIGKSPPANLERGSAIYIPTGGVMPEGADSVVMVEYTKEDDGKVSVFRPSRKGENVALAGSDIPEGELIIRKGSRIGPRELAVLSSLGIRKINVSGKIRIGIVSTGDELAEPGSALQKGKIYDSNGRTIKSLIDQVGGPFDVKLYGTLPDIEQIIRDRLDLYSSENDILIVSGSTSAGEKDMVYRILGEYSPGIVFHGIKIKPGKPTLLSRKGEKIVIGLPGFPVSAMMTFLTIFFPYILREAGITSDESTIEGILAGKVALDVGKLNLIPVSAVKKDTILAFPIHGGSGSISRVLRADGYISVYGDRRTAEEGDPVTIRLFGTKMHNFDYVATGENDRSMDTLSRNSSVKVIKTGHFGAINSVLKGYSDIGGAVSHGQTIDTSIYAGHASQGSLKVLWSEERKLGMAWRKDVEKPLTALAGIPESNTSIAIPSKSEGAQRVLMRIIEESGVDPDKFYSSSSETGNLNSVAFAVSEGYYPAGITDRETAARYGLSFEPLAKFYYVIFCREGMEEELSFIGHSM